MADEVLSQRALNRATLARQLLLERAAMPALAAVEHLLGMQAQIPLDPYTGLWSRLAGFRADELASLLVDRAVVRIVVMRGTIHLVTADDCLLIRPLMQPVLDAELARHGQFAGPLAGVDLAPVLSYARRLFEERPRSGNELRRALAAEFPDLDAAALAYACRNHLALVQVPPRGVWGQSAQVTLTTAEAWLGRPLATAPSLADVVLRYFGAYGPASVADVSAWTRLTGLRPVVEGLRPRLRAFRTEAGRELFDDPDAARPDPDTPAPVRFLPEYDNVLLSHADRSRFGTKDVWTRIGAAGPVKGTVLHDGTVAATWRIDAGTLVVHHAALPRAATAEIEREGRRYLEFAGGQDVRFISA